MAGLFAVGPLLAPITIKDIGLLNPDCVQYILHEHFSGKKSYGFEIWGLLILSAWYQARIVNTIPLPNKEIPQRKIFPYIKDNSYS